MSIRTVADVFRYSQATGSDRLVLLAIADEADDDGSNAFPSMDRIAAKAKVSKSTALRSVHRLEELGEIEVSRPGTRARGRHNTYRVVMPVDNPAKNGVNLTPLAGELRSTTVQNGSRPCLSETVPIDPQTHNPSSSSSTASGSVGNTAEDELRAIAENRALIAYRAQTHQIINPQAWIAKAIDNELDRLRLEPPALRLCGECDNGWLLADNGDAVRCECRRSA